MLKSKAPLKAKVNLADLKDKSFFKLKFSKNLLLEYSLIILSALVCCKSLFNFAT